MRSEVLYTTEQGYISGTTDTVELYDGAFLQMIGRGDGTVDWAGETGTIEWTNFPPRRPDGVYLPDITGMIRLNSRKRPVLYRMRGISLLPEGDSRVFAGPVRWYTDEEDLAWLNDRWGYEEGELDLTAMRFRTRAWVLHPEAPAS